MISHSDLVAWHEYITKMEGYVTKITSYPHRGIWGCFGKNDVFDEIYAHWFLSH